MESLTFKFIWNYAKKDNKYINAVVGLSALRIDSIYLGKISGRRNGKQAFSSINFRTKNNYGKLNITPTENSLTELQDYLSILIL